MTDDHIALVWWCVDRFVSRLLARGVDKDELFSRGLMGLAAAHREFDKTKGFQFSTFAVYKIYQEIFKPSGIKENYWRESSQKFETIRRLFFQRTGRTLSNEQLASLCGVTEACINRMKISQGFVSLENGNEQREDNKDNIFSKFDPTDYREQLPEEAGTLNESYFVETVHEIINDRSILTNEERKIIKLYFGINLPRRFFGKEIGLLLGLCGDNMYLRIRKILEKLSANKRLQELQLAEA
jgi:DNA-directed RNA polymerase specialized sigma subunit